MNNISKIILQIKTQQGLTEQCNPSIYVTSSPDYFADGTNDKQ